MDNVKKDRREELYEFMSKYNIDSNWSSSEMEDSFFKETDPWDYCACVKGVSTEEFSSLQTEWREHLSSTSAKIIMDGVINNAKLDNETKNQLIESAEQIFDQMLDTMKAKNADYAGNGDPYKNFELVEYLGVCSAETGILVRMCDKVSRIATLIGENKDGQVKDESVQDTLKDLANYSVILTSYMKDKKTQEGSNV